MSGSLNKAFLIGNLCADPEVRSFTSGDKVANLRVATNETWKDRHTGEKKERVEFHTVTVKGKSVQFVEQYMRKGDKVHVEGKIQTRSWEDQSGQKRYSTEVSVAGFGTNIMKLDKRDDNQGGSYGSSGGNGGYGAGGIPNSGRDLDDEIPFSFNGLA